MIQEYLFIGKEHRAAVEQYSVASCKKEIHDLVDSACWIVTFSKDGENERNAKLLSSVHSYIVNSFHATVLMNGSSAYYNKILYPYFNEFERKLRKLLYIKGALSKDLNGGEEFKSIESKDFGAIFALLFSDNVFVQETRALVNNKSWQFTKEEISTAIQQLAENTLWDKAVGKNAAPLLRSNFSKVKAIRNDVMHAHNMETSDYHKAYKLITEVNKQLDAEINKSIRYAEEHVNEGIRGFNTVLGDIARVIDQAQIVRNLQEQIFAVQSHLPAIKKSDILESLTSQVDIAPALAELRRRIDSIQQSVPSAYIDPAGNKLHHLNNQPMTTFAPTLKETQEENNNGKNEI